MKELFREPDVVRNVQEIQFGVFSSSEIEHASVAQLNQIDYYIGGNPLTPIPNGALDTRMGTSQKGVTCSTCSKNVLECVGHFGYIELESPVFHVGYFDKIVKLLQCICKRCSHVLLEPEDKTNLCRQARNPNRTFSQMKVFCMKVNERCKKVKRCPNCDAINGIVKKVPILNITHEKFRGVKNSQELIDFKDEFKHAIAFSKDLESVLPANPIEFIQPKDAYLLFKQIPLDNLPLFGMNAKHAHPKDLIIWRLPASPNCIRPSVVSELKAGTNQDDISELMRSIIYLNNKFKRLSTTSKEIPMDTWDCLQLTTAFLMNSEITVPRDFKLAKENTRGFVQRLKGKQGRFRGNLSAKRVDFTSRTVISPDPNLRINQVGVPEEVAKLLTYPERVNPHNIKLMRQLVINGPNVHPGAICIELKSNPGIKRALGYVNRERMAYDLKLGDKIERHLLDGDVVLFNRQPSLHKMSIMAHQAKVLPWRTFRFNECVCAPYNADFDGDEMNLHLPQTEEARAEAYVLMNVKSNLVTPRHGALIIGATQDFLTGSYLLTQKDQFFDKEHTMQLVSSIICGSEAKFKIQLPPPAIMKPIELWTGKQIFSTILCPFKGKNSPFPLCNLVTNKKDYTKCEEFCKNEGRVVFRNSELIAGSLDKSLLGSGHKKNLFYVILKDFGKQQAADAMFRVARVSTNYLINKGFSIGIGDVMPGSDLLSKKRNLLDKGYIKCQRYIDQLEANTLPCQPGCTPEESLEQFILKTLSSIRDDAGKACVNELHKTNAALIMALSGSKGSFINISQMIACVGQQAIGGKRVPSGFVNRALPHFKQFAKEPAAKGFVSNSFFSGITPSEFFFHTMAGREGLVDTAVKTAETGYMQRRLVKCLEDLYVAYDDTVRTSSQEVIQFKYGYDGLDPSELEDNTWPVDFERALYHIRAVNYMDPGETRLSGAEVLSNAKKYMENIPFKVLSDTFKESISMFLEKYGKVIDDKRESLGKDQRKSLPTNNNELKLVCYEMERLTLDQLFSFLDLCLDRYQASLMEPGTAVGALCARSIGEPGTQMTLKTFHFAGVAAMNITLGVPRILEIINASNAISTPIITAKLKVDGDEEIARQVKGRIEKTLLGEVCESINEIYKSSDSFLLIKLHLDRIKLLKLEVNVSTIKYSICSSKLKLKESDIEICDEQYIKIRPLANKTSCMYYQMQYLKHHITRVVIKGLPSISRAVINMFEEEPRKYELIVEGNNFREVIGTYGVEGKKCRSNNTREVFATLGIAAARDTIITEITETMETHGLSVDHRHVMLLADLMTATGEVLGIQRSGLGKMNKSVLVRASFERTANHLFDASYHGENNPITGVSECIIMGKPMTIGTGLFKLLHKHKKVNINNNLSLIFDTPEFHVPIGKQLMG